MIAQLVVAAAAALLAVWGCHRLITLRHALRASPTPSPPVPQAGWRVPRVTVQLPVYNEPLVAVRAVQAACALRWPDLEVQVLDDSTDETPALVAHAVLAARSRGVDVQHLRRCGRSGFKAGALAHGLGRSRADLVAIFDADFVPDPGFLERTVPHFGDVDASGPDMVQARWGHLNRNASWLTRAQAVLLDTHFFVEQRGRAASGRFFGFNGTAGVWKRSAIERAGGWQADTLTEDLDLSLRAWLRGARFAYVDDVVAPAELPASIHALRVQQQRWARGAMQTARLRLGEVWRSGLPFVEKLDVSLKLTQNFAFVWMLVAVTALPFAALERASGAGHSVALDVVAAAGGAMPALLSFSWALLRRERAFGAALVDIALAVGLAAALSAQAAAAALAGLLASNPVPFHRTPKDGARLSLERPDAGPVVVLEAALATLHLSVALHLCLAGRPALTPFLWLCGGALATVAASSWRSAAAAPDVEKEPREQRGDDDDAGPGGLMPLAGAREGEHRLVQQG